MPWDGSLAKSAGKHIVWRRAREAGGKLHGFPARRGAGGETIGEQTRRRVPEPGKGEGMAMRTIAEKAAAAAKLAAAAAAIAAQCAREHLRRKRRARAAGHDAAATGRTGE